MQLVWTLRFFQAILQAHGTTDKKDNYIACSGGNVFYLFPWKLQVQDAQEHYLTENTLSYRTIFQHSHHH